MEKTTGLVLCLCLAAGGCSTTPPANVDVGPSYVPSAHFAQSAVRQPSDVAIIRNNYETVIWNRDPYEHLMRSGWEVKRESVLVIPPQPSLPPAAVKPEPTVQKQVVTTISRIVHFNFDSASIKPKEREFLAEAPWSDADEILIDGYTDSIGSDKYNQDLSKKRAESVARYLRERGISLNKMRILAHGESEPVADNGSKFGRAKNRRVVVHLKIPDQSAQVKQNTHEKGDGHEK